MKHSGPCRIYNNAREALREIDSLRAKGKTLVTTNGCFDILHAGHVRYLREAASMGDILAVGVNCDDVVRRQKGPDRPLQPQGDRCEVLAALEMVDCVFVFDEDDPRTFIGVLHPDVHVKGGDYDASKIIEREAVEAHGGTVRTVTYHKGRSTSSLVRRCQGDFVGPLHQKGTT